MTGTASPKSAAARIHHVEGTNTDNTGNTPDTDNNDETLQPVAADPLPPTGDAMPQSNSDGNTDLPIQTCEINGNNDSPATVAPLTQQEDDKNNAPAPDVSDQERPSKRRRVRDTTPHNPIRRPKVESPPWKKVEADGPTTFIEDGKRRSGRTNMLPPELQPKNAKRMTRGTLNAAQSPPSQQTRRTGTANNTPKTVSTPRSSSMRAPPPATKSSSKKPLSSASRSSPRTRTASTPSHPPAVSPKRSLPTRRSSRTRRDSNDAVNQLPDPQDSPNSSRPTRIRLRIKNLTIPLVHPAQANVIQGQTLPRPRVSSSFEQYVALAPALEIREGGWFDMIDDGPSYTQEMADKDAKIVLRIEKEVEPGGLLSEGRSSLFAPEPAEEPPRQWAHTDHLVKQMANFRKLMVMEHQRHKATAKKVAEACRDAWLRRQPKTVEEIEAEAQMECVARYRLVVKALVGTWDNVRTEINRRRLEEWEAAEQKRVKAALNEVVSMSELKLRARQDPAGSGVESDEDEDEEDQTVNGSEDGDGGDEMDVDLDESASELGSIMDEDNMSSDEGDDDDDDDDVKSTVSDEGLTQDQLRQKYAKVPDLATLNPEDHGQDPGRHGTEMAADDPADTTDESIDMDDDMTSSDENINSAEDDDSGDESEDSEGGADGSAGLLGLFFGKKELKKLKEDASPGDEQPAAHVTPDMETQSLVTDRGGPTIEQSEVNGHIKPEPTATGLDLQQTSNKHAEIGHPAKFSGTNMDISSSAAVSSAFVTHENMVTTTTALVPPSVNDVKMEADRTAELLEDGVTQEGGVVPRELTAVAVTSIETPPSLSDQHHPVSETDAVTDSVSRDRSQYRSQSPHTSETKPSEVDTASSAMKSGISRSTTPPQSPKTDVPFLLRGSLREYQHYGLDWLAGLYKNQTNGILADEMGLGKTIQTIALLAHLACHHEVWGPHLVIVPTSVMLNWEMEFKKWCPGFKVLSYYGSIEERKRKRQGWKTDDMWNVCITSYQIVLQDQQVFKRRQWHYMILDEAHNIKNFKSKRWQTLLGFNTQARLLLTGTPLQNNLTELWSLLFFLMPSNNGVGGFADLAEFQDWFHKPESQILESGREQMDDEARAIIAKLHKVLRPYLLRRLKADVEKQMPAKYEHVELCRLSRRQRELYDGFLARTDTREALASGNYISVINCLMQLRKVCNHPDLFVERPIMTSLRQPKSIIAEFSTTEALLRKRFLASHPMASASLSFLNLIPRQYESASTTVCDRVFELSSDKSLLELYETQEARAQLCPLSLDPSSTESNIAFLDSMGRRGRLGELKHCIYVNGFRRQQRPIYGKQLIDFLTLDIDQAPFRSRPKIPQKIMSWFEEDSPVLRSIIPTLDARAASMRTTISKFACVTPAVVTRDLDQFVLGSSGVEQFEDANLRLSAPIRYIPFMPKEAPIDPWHESRMRLSIQFPDKRLLQYDCGKLQVLDKLLRKLQSGGHRALIFTQMTKVLDVLEQFLNIHGHKYLRLDGATKVEQRQILTDRFNHDSRILCFILSTRSGGLGINLTGADTVIFYDQDWNPAMDKKCQDRCHRIGQTRDVHIYRLVSEHTIEANILRKASQKQMLDDIVIQEGGFTTDYFNKLSVRDVISGVTDEGDVVGDAMDRVLGGVESVDQRTVGRVLEQAEDREDVAAAHVAEKEIQEDEADFAEKAPTMTASRASSTRQGTPTTQDGHFGMASSRSGALSEVNAHSTVQEVEHNAWGERMYNIDDYMLKTMSEQLEGTALELPKDKKKSKKGKDTRKR